MKKILAILMILTIAISLTACGEGNIITSSGGQAEVDSEQVSSEDLASEISTENYNKNIYGVLKALTDNEIIVLTDSDKKAMLDFFAEETGEAVEDSVKNANEVYRKANQVGKISDKVRIMSADVIGAKSGVKITYKDDKLNKNITLELYEYNSQDFTANQYVKDASENGIIVLLDTEVPAEIFGNYMLIYSDTVEDIENVQRKTEITSILKTLSE